MANEIVITPRNSEDVEVGTFVDDCGGRYVGLSFVRPSEGDRVIVTFTPEFFQAFAKHIARVAELADDPKTWVNHPV